MIIHAPSYQRPSRWDLPNNAVHAESIDIGKCGFVVVLKDIKCISRTRATISYFADFMHYALITYAKVRGKQATAWYTAFAKAAFA